MKRSARVFVFRGIPLAPEGDRPRGDPCDGESLERAEALGVEIGAEESIAQIRYSGGGQDTTIRSHWRDEGDTPRIVAGQPV